MSSRVVIIGAGGLGRVALEALRLSGTHTPVGFIDADASRIGSTVADLPILGPIHMLEKLCRQEISAAIVAIGDNRTRQSYAQLVRQAGMELINILHPRAIISPSAKLGVNLFVAAGAIIGSEVELADGVLVESAALIDNECRLGAWVHIAPATALAGRVQMGESSFAGFACRIASCIKIGRQAVIPAGAFVAEDIPDAGGTL